MNAPTQALRWFPILATLALSVALAAPAYAAAQAADPAVRVLSTGIGLDERKPHPEYSLKLTFAERAGPYVAGIEVVILRQDGREVVRTASPGPWLFVNLPAGTYRVMAVRANGVKAGAAFTITAGKQLLLPITW
ncbi:MAG: hypothetical protein HY423_05505 [Candidatus Lambdaproteobacteria bacterium]|nr:hypothetical protein [Candidatus Lambdaproteobacteria bacterium]